jgi:heparanase 1
MTGCCIGLRVVIVVLLGAAALHPCWTSSCAFAASSVAVAPHAMTRLGEIGVRFQSYNIEMVEVTGGYFWRPYHDHAKPSPAGMPAGLDPSMVAYRKPIDLSDPRLRKLAAALGPAYLRVSGTWANATYFDDADDHAASPPKGFGGMLTRAQWEGVVDFSRAVDAKLVTSFATVAATRDADGVWTPAQAGKLIAFTHAIGGSIAAAELINEPDLAAMGAVPPHYDAAGFARDIAAFRSFLDQAAPRAILLGPGTVSGDAADGTRSATGLVAASGSMFDAISFHHYGAPSQRCTGVAAQDEAALSDDWMSDAAGAESFYAGLRDRYAPGRALWITETADASCGGNPRDATFLDSFRYLDLLGRMAQRGVQVVMHNTLAASDYGLLDERDFTPRPDYWAALLWRRLMGTTVLDPGAPASPRLDLYAHCLRGTRGGVALLAINRDRVAPRSLGLPTPARRYALTAVDLTATRARLNGSDLRLDEGGELPSLQGEAVGAGRLDLPPASITFLAVADAANPACR